MNRWDIIKHKCPKLYKNPIHFECGQGWADLIEDLSIKIEAILERMGLDSEIFAVQVKEKYGTLRFYMSCETDEIIDLISEAESLSSKVCENCGEPAKMRGIHWMEVKCDKCYKDNK